MVKHIFHFSLWNQKLVMCENSWTLSGTSGVCTTDRATCDLLVISFPNWLFGRQPSCTLFETTQWQDTGFLPTHVRARVSVGLQYVKHLHRWRRLLHKGVVDAQFPELQDMKGVDILKWRKVGTQADGGSGVYKTRSWEKVEMMLGLPAQSWGQPEEEREATGSHKSEAKGVDTSSREQLDLKGVATRSREQAEMAWQQSCSGSRRDAIARVRSLLLFMQ